MPKQRTSRLYKRGNRWWGDFRDFSDVGGSREALKPDGAGRATTDAEVAEALAGDRVEELQKRRHRRNVLGVEEERRAALKDYASEHLKEKAREGHAARWLKAVEGHLREAVSFFGAERDLRTIRPAHVRRYLRHLEKKDNGRGGKLSSSTQRKYIHSLSNLYRRAQADGYVKPGHNPVALLMEKPRPSSAEVEWLKVPEAALLLEAARLYKPGAETGPLPFAHPLVATFLLTGGRKSEVLGLRVEDVAFDWSVVHIRPNEHRGLKTKSSKRKVPLWPQLEEVLREHIFGGSGPRSGLLFPSHRTGKMVKNLRKLLDTLGEKAELGKVRSKAFRHTYAAARLQTLDAGKPVSEYTVARELGHSSPTMIRERYGHLGEKRHRSEVVEYRVEQHGKELGKRLLALHARAS